MSLKHLIKICLITVCLFASKVFAKDYFSSKTKSNYWTLGTSVGRFTRMAVSFQFKDIPEPTRKEYFRDNIANRDEKIFSIFNDLKMTKNITENYEFVLHKNENYFSNNFNFFFEIISKKSHESFNACLVVEATPFLASEAYEKLGKEKIEADHEIDYKFPGNYCMDVFIESQYRPDFNWKKFSYYFFGIVKIYFQIFSIFVIIGRLFVPKYSKLRIIWISQTIIFWQFLMYSGFQSGNFGGVIDDIHEGIIETSQKFMFMDVSPIISKKFNESIRGFVVYKFYINDVRPALTYQALYEVLALLAVVVLQEISKLTKMEKFKRRIKEINSGLGLVIMVKMLFIIEYSIYAYAVIGDYSTIWHWANAALFAFVGVYYVLRVLRMTVTVKSIKYLHSRGVYQEGKVEIEQGSDWASDTYISMDTNITYRVLEFILLVLIPANYTTGYEEFELGASFNLIGWVLMALLTFQKLIKFEGGSRERDDTKIIITLSLGYVILSGLQSLIIWIFCFTKKMSLGFVKFFTVVYIVILFLNTGILLVQALLRLKFATTLPDYIRDRREDLRRKKLFEEYERKRIIEEEKERLKKKKTLDGNK